ncbi:hydrolase [Acidihalobacter prosperus]
MPTGIQLCRSNHSHLLLIDLQSKLLNAVPEVERRRTVHNAGILLRASQLLGIPMLVSEQYPRGLGSTDPQLSKLLTPDIPVIEKTSFSCCNVPNYKNQLQSTTRDQTVLAGIEAHICVLQTALDLAALGKQVFVVEDAICARDPMNKTNAVARLRQAGVIVTNTESVVFEWLNDASHPQFKSVSALIH